MEKKTINDENIAEIIYENVKQINSHELLCNIYIRLYNRLKLINIPFETSSIKY